MKSDRHKRIFPTQALRDEVNITHYSARAHVLHGLSHGLFANLELRFVQSFCLCVLGDKVVAGFFPRQVASYIVAAMKNSIPNELGVASLSSEAFHWRPEI
jgi:hypothetical protein